LTAARNAARLRRRAKNLAADNSVLAGVLGRLADGYVNELRPSIIGATEEPLTEPDAVGPDAAPPTDDDLVERLVNAALAFVEAAETVADAHPEVSTRLLDIAAQTAHSVLEVIRTWQPS
jgi:hypothetical protein